MRTPNCQSSRIIKNTASTNNMPTIAIAGGSGFMGTSLRIALAHKYRWQALTRSASVAQRDNTSDNTTWRQCDLFSFSDVKQALKGAQYGIYFVHSMLPSSRLVQGSFQDLDLQLADNFIRAAEAVGIQHIIYLGGLIPADLPSNQLSKHLASRLEVEAVLRSHAIPISVIRAGLIFGPGGSSMQMLINLVRHLPIMLLPKWTQSFTQSTDYRDIICACELLLDDPSLTGGTYDIGGHRPMTYRTMILATAALLNRKPVTFDLPLNVIGISRLWVALFGKVPPDLVNPLLDSLKHSLMARPNVVQSRISHGAIPFEQSVKDAIDNNANPLPNPRFRELPKDNVLLKQAKRVRSVQRMPLPHGWDAKQLAHTYFQWLHQHTEFICDISLTSDGVTIRSKTPVLDLLCMRLTPNSLKRQRRYSYFIESGVLVRSQATPGRFDFITFPENNCAIIAIHDFAPALPWWLYQYTQANLHLFVMTAFREYLVNIEHRILNIER